MGVAVEVEVSTNRGRIDSVIKTKKTVYVFEFKLRGSAQDALDQIRDKGYAEPFATDGREVICVGVAFDSEQRNIGEWIVERPTAAQRKDEG